MGWFLFGKGREHARQAEAGFTSAMADLRKVKDSSIEVLRQKIRAIQIDVHEQANEIPSLPPESGPIEALPEDEKVIEEEPVTVPDAPNPFYVRPADERPEADRPQVPRPGPRKPFQRPIPRTEPPEAEGLLVARPHTKPTR